MNQDTSNLLSMAGLNDGQSAYINNIALTGILRRRIFDLGLIPGTKVKCIRRSPAGNPIAYAIRGTLIALRKEDAALIQVSLRAEDHYGQFI